MPLPIVCLHTHTPHGYEVDVAVVHVHICGVAALWLVGDFDLCLAVDAKPLVVTGGRGLHNLQRAALADRMLMHWSYQHAPQEVIRLATSVTVCA